MPDLMPFIIIVLKEGAFPTKPSVGCSVHRWIHQHSFNKLDNYDEECLVTPINTHFSLLLFRQATQSAEEGV